MRVLRLISLAVLTTVLCGCASSQHQLSAVAAFDQGQPEAAIPELAQAATARNAEVDLLRADQAVCLLMLGENRQAEHALHEIRTQLDYLTQKDLREQTASYLTDEKAVAWTGREFEKRMLDCLLVLASLTGDRQDAYAYASSVSEHLLAEREQVEASVTVAADDQTVTATVTATATATATATTTATTTAFEAAPDQILPTGHTQTSAPPPAALSTNALAAYLLAAVHSELPMNGDDMQAALEQVRYWHPDSPDVSQAEFGVHTPPEHGTLHVVTCVGRITDWQAESVQPTSAALLLADRILSSAGDHSLPPTVAPVRIARPVRRDSQAPQGDSLIVTPVSDGTSTANTRAVASETLIDLNRIAHASYLASRDQVVAKAVARRVIKKGVVYATKDRLDVDRNSGADLLLSLGGVAWEALEKPDLRHLRLLPERIEVAVVPLPVGQYRLQSRTDSATARTDEQATQIEIVNGRNTFVVRFQPSAGVTHMVGGR